MKVLILIIVVAIFSFYFVVVKNGKLSFWSKAAKEPDLFYDLISRDSTWIIEDGVTHIDKDDFNGPFRLYVPSLGKVVKFWGCFDNIEKSQADIVKKVEFFTSLKNKSK